MKIQYISDDGKKVGTQEEVRQYEATTSAETSDWKQVQNATEKLNALIENYREKYKGGISITMNDGKLTCEKLSSEIDAIMKMFNL